jgi:uncharacterized membrane protein
VAEPTTTRPTRRLPALALAAVGFLLSVALEVVHVRAHLDPAAASFCAAGEGLDCDAVALSRFSVVLGIPLPIAGMAGFLALALAIVHRSRLFLPLAVVAALGSAALFVEEIAHIGSICLLCEGVHAAAFGLLGIAWVQRRDNAGLSRRRAALELGLPAALLVAAVVGVPPYWALVSWKSGVRYAQGIDEHGRPWIGAENPTVTVVEYVDYGCPHCAIATGQLRMLVGRHPDQLRVVRHHQPRMRCRLGRQCLFARVAICAGAQGRFWEMDDWLFRHAPGHENVDVERATLDVGLDAARMSACVDDPATWERVARDEATARAARIVETPTYTLDEGAPLTPLELHEALEALL